MRLRRFMLVVALLSINAAVAADCWRRCYLTSTIEGPDPIHYAEFDVGPCRLAYEASNRLGSRIEWQPYWTGPTVLWRRPPVIEE